MRTSESINELAAALSAAQGEFTTIEKRKHANARGISKAGKEYSISYAYADISDVLAAVLPALSKHKLSVVQPTCIGEHGMFIATRLMHSSGQWIESDYPVCSINGDHQKMGAANTYARRYALTSLLGVAADEDTDGQGADSPPNKMEPAKPAPAKPAPAKPAPAKPVAARGEWPTQSNDAMLRDKARGMAREGRKAFDTWWATLTDEQCNEVNVIAEELAEIAYAVDQAELARA